VLSLPALYCAAVQRSRSPCVALGAGLIDGGGIGEEAAKQETRGPSRHGLR
jgi:hypothetical protein